MMDIMDLISMMEIRKSSIMSMMSIMAGRSKVLELLCESCEKIEFPGKRYNASNPGFLLWRGGLNL